MARCGKALCSRSCSSPSPAGAVSGFHALISSGTTPKLLANETDARFIGYGAMLMESFVAIMALVAASIIEPGLYFAMNTPPAGLASPCRTDECGEQTRRSSWRS
ncbi:carbon starvation CstA family protein [Escherichia coli]